MTPQRARDTATGAEVYSVERDAEVYELAGRRWQLFVERASGAVGVWLPATPRWDDGSPLTAAEVAQAREVLTRVYGHWGYTVDFVAPPATDAP